jgi:hypothetical protein
VYSVYVTDYTANDQMHTIAAKWCDTLLANRVLKIEMWEDAATFARESMKPGEYYFLNNVKMKIGRAGYVEGTMTYPEKNRKLLEEDAERSPHWRELLRYIHGTHPFFNLGLEHNLFSQAQEGVDRGGQYPGDIQCLRAYALRRD